MGEKKKRKHSVGKIDRLPPELKFTVEQMIASRKYYYKDIVGFLKENGELVSLMCVQRFAEKYRVSLEQIQVIQENFRALSEEVEKYPNMDTMEPILRIASHHALTALTSSKDEQWKNMDPEKLLSSVTSLIRAVSYKRKTDLANKTDQEAALDANKALLGDLLGKKHPELFKQVMDALDQEQALLQDTEDV